MFSSGLALLFSPGGPQPKLRLPCSLAFGSLTSTSFSCFRKLPPDCAWQSWKSLVSTVGRLHEVFGGGGCWRRCCLVLHWGWGTRGVSWTKISFRGPTGLPELIWVTCLPFRRWRFLVQV